MTDAPDAPLPVIVDLATRAPWTRPMGLVVDRPATATAAPEDVVEGALAPGAALDPVTAAIARELGPIAEGVFDLARQSALVHLDQLKINCAFSDHLAALGARLARLEALVLSAPLDTG